MMNRIQVNEYDMPNSGELEVGIMPHPTMSVPCTTEEMKAQIRRSEKQIDAGQYVTADNAIRHFYQL